MKLFLIQTWSNFMKLTIRSPRYWIRWHRCLQGLCCEKMLRYWKQHDARTIPRRWSEKSRSWSQSCTVLHVVDLDRTSFPEKKTCRRNFRMFFVATTLSENVQSWKEELQDQCSQLKWWGSSQCWYTSAAWNQFIANNCSLIDKARLAAEKALQQQAGIILSS